VAAPVAGFIPPAVFGGLSRINIEPVRFTFAVYDPETAMNGDVFDTPFREGVTFLAIPEVKTTVMDRTGNYGIKTATPKRACGWRPG
jgi:hypothetical protein